MHDLYFMKFNIILNFFSKVIDEALYLAGFYNLFSLGMVYFWKVMAAEVFYVSYIY
jgi:hypothetical protein